MNTLIIIIIGILLMCTVMKTEMYDGRRGYRYGSIDTNPVRRVSGFFDGCSPENMGDCKRNNPYKGLPLP
jgi:hypothetical protein